MSATNYSPDTYWQGGKRFDSNASAPDLDAIAQKASGMDFASLQAVDPEAANAILMQYGDPSQGQQVTQVANNDNLDTKRLGLLLAGEVGMGFLNPEVWGGAAAGGGGGGAAEGGSLGNYAANAVADTAAKVGGSAMGKASFLSGLLSGKNPLLSIGTGVAQDIYNAHQQSKTREQQQQQFEERLAEEKRQFDATNALAQQQFGQGQAVQGLNATQMDPLSQAKARTRAGILAALLQGGNLREGLASAGPAAAFLSPEAMQGSENQFTQQAQNASGGRYQPNAAPGYDAYTNALKLAGRVA